MPDPAFWQGRRVLLTGHTGFKGGWLTLWLASMGARVTGYSTPSPTDPALFTLARVGEACAESVLGDLRDEAHLRAVVERVEPEVVIHMAAQPIVRRSFIAPAETWETNVMGTVALLEAVRATGGVQAVVVVTSDKCYRDVDARRPLREDDALGGKDPYSASKAGQELVVASHRATLLGEHGVAVATGRAGNVIGGGDWGADRLVPDLFRAALAGTPLVIRNPDAVRPWQHVLNPLSGYLLLAQALCESGPGDGIDAGWNFGPDAGDELPVSTVVERIAALWDGDVEVRVERDQHAGKEAPVLRLDSTRVRERLGWRPRWDLEAGLRQTVEWFAAHRAGEDMRAVTERQIRAYAQD